MIVFGLGNKGLEFDGTRHNVGFEVVNRLHRDVWLTANDYEFATYKTNHVIVKPTIGMNNSGVVAWFIQDAFKLHTSDIVVVHDDMDIELGRIKIKSKGGDGRHNGVKSIIKNCHSGRFIRVKVGIGKPPSAKQGADFVLSRFNKSERELVDVGIKSAVSAVDQILTGGVQSAMSVFNKRM